MDTSNMQKDLVLSINEYAYVLDETKGHVSCLVGPTKMSLSQSDKLVLFDPHSKSFIPAPTMDRAKSLFTTAPEGWYVILKNPADSNRHPSAGTSNSLPENVHVGKKINITGPVSFALYPGQMAKVIKGHALRSNQYLLARVYEAAAANANQGKVFDAEGKEIENTVTNCVNGQILVIKGTEISFYIPPTGIEIIPIDNDPREGYVRDAVTLERLEYCILKDENGSKRYVHGPQVVFPKPTETFVNSTRGSTIFKAIELSKISGIYIKVIAEYTDEAGVLHPAGEEMFITGEQQMIYYPRPEHAIINYDGKVVHHAIAIPEGEGRYIMDRLTGEIKTVKGPAMYLPDPRTEIVVKRKLTPRQSMLWYPGNREVLNYNEILNEKVVEKSTVTKSLNYYDSAWTTMDSYTTTANAALVTDPFCLDQLESKASISRGTSYTKPRTITLDNKFEGVVTLDVWTGYAVNVISKNGERKVVCGPQTVMLDYDQTLEVLHLSTGKPKTTDRIEETVFLRYDNNKISDLIEIETKDYVNATIKVSYNVSFNQEFKDKWFNSDNYVKLLCDRARAAVRSVAKQYGINEFYANYHDIVARTVIENLDFSSDNGMQIVECDVFNINIDDEVADILENQQRELVSRSIELTNAETRYEIEKSLAETELKEHEIINEKSKKKIEMQTEVKELQIVANQHLEELAAAKEKAAKQAESDMQFVLDAIANAERNRKDADLQQQIDHAKKLAEIEAEKQKAYTESVKQIISSIGPELAAALSSKANADTLVAVSKAVSPYTMAGDNESVADVVNKLMRGTTLEQFVENM